MCRLSSKSIIWVLGLAYATSAHSQVSLSALGSYSASVRDSDSATDFYEGFGVGGSVGLRRSATEYFLSYRQSMQEANYSNITDPEFFDHSFRIGVRYEQNWSSPIFPVFELAGDVILLGSNGSGSGLGYGGSVGLGLGLRVNSRLGLRIVPELGMLFFSYSSLRRRFFNQRAELVLRL